MEEGGHHKELPSPSSFCLFFSISSYFDATTMYHSISHFTYCKIDSQCLKPFCPAAHFLEEIPPNSLKTNFLLVDIRKKEALD